VRQFARFTTDPLELRHDPEELAALLALVDGGDLLLFASAGRSDTAAESVEAIDALPAAWRAKILRENAQDVYRFGEVAV
jgi:hypothetical protein